MFSARSFESDSKNCFDFSSSTGSVNRFEVPFIGCEIKVSPTLFKYRSGEAESRNCLLFLKKTENGYELGYHSDINWLIFDDEREELDDEREELLDDDELELDEELLLDELLEFKALC